MQGFTQSPRSDFRHMENSESQNLTEARQRASFHLRVAIGKASRASDKRAWVGGVKWAGQPFRRAIRSRVTSTCDTAKEEGRREEEKHLRPTILSYLAHQNVFPSLSTTKTQLFFTPKKRKIRNRIIFHDNSRPLAPRDTEKSEKKTN